MSGPVVVYGSVAWDEIYVLDSYPGAHQKVTALGFVVGLGGSAANTSTWLAHYRGDVHFLGAVGDDPEGGYCLRALEQAGVKTSHTTVVSAAPTARATSWVVGADKRIVKFRDRQLFREHASAQELELVRRACHLHVGSHFDGAGYECIEAARAAGATISTELSGQPDPALREHSDVVFMNSEELRHLFRYEVGLLGPEPVAQIVLKSRGALVVTDGPRAVYAATADEVIRVDVEPLANVVDRTGGGDSFDAGFLAVWLDGQGLAAAISNGNATSRRALSQLGAARSG